MERFVCSALGPQRDTTKFLVTGVTSATTLRPSGRLLRLSHRVVLHPNTLIRLFRRECRLRTGKWTWTGRSPSIEGQNRKSTAHHASPFARRSFAGRATTQLTRIERDVLTVLAPERGIDVKGATTTTTAAGVVKDATGIVPGTSTASETTTGRGTETGTGIVRGIATGRDVGIVTENVIVLTRIGQKVGTVTATGSGMKGIPRIDAGRGMRVTISWTRRSVPRGRNTTRGPKSHRCLHPLRLQVFLRLRLHCLIARADAEMARANVNAGTETGVPELAIRATSSMTCRVIAVIGTENANHQAV